MLDIISFLVTGAHATKQFALITTPCIAAGHSTGRHTLYSGVVADPTYCREGCVFLALRALIACASSADLAVKMDQQLLTLLAMSTTHSHTCCPVLCPPQAQRPTWHVSAERHCTLVLPIQSPRACMG